MRRVISILCLSFCTRQRTWYYVLIVYLTCRWIKPTHTIATSWMPFRILFLKQQVLPSANAISIIWLFKILIRTFRICRRWQWRMNVICIAILQEIDIDGVSGRMHSIFVNVPHILWLSLGVPLHIHDFYLMNFQVHQ